MNSEKNYSIIIPHKNIPTLLQRCLDSIPRREDVQVIVIDDSNPDIVNSKQFPGLNDPFVELIFQKEGKGIGFARNAGLAKAVGKWLLFADADDFFNDCINDILDEYIHAEKDIIYFKHNAVDSDTLMPASRCESHNTYIDNWFHSPKKHEPQLRYINTVAWAKLYHAEFIKKRNIMFDEVSMGEDVAFVYTSGFYASSISVDSRTLYCTTIRKGSNQRIERTFDHMLDTFFVHCKRFRFYADHNIPIPYRRLNNRITLTKLLIKFNFHSKSHFYKAREILASFKITNCDIIKLFIYDILVLVPKRILGKLFSRS